MIYLGIDGSISRVRLEGLRVAPVLYSIYRSLPLHYFDTYTHIALDSGAYPCWTHAKKEQGKTDNPPNFTVNGAVDFNYYLDTALSWQQDGRKFTWIAADLSVDESFDDTLKNCEALRKHGLNALPAYKQGQPEWQLLYLCNNFDHIGLGSTDKDTGSQSTDRWLRQAFDVICDNDGYPTVKVHGYRLVSYYDKYPFNSCDSTSWAQRTLPDLKKRIPWAKESELIPHVLTYYTRRPRCPRFIRDDQLEFKLAS